MENSVSTATATRKITIVDSNASKKVVLEGVFNTFGELKEAARKAGVNVNQDWLEGITKTSPMDDSSILPTNVNFKGTTTNNLVYMLTSVNKKVRSGATRAEIVAKLKEYNLMDSVKLMYGKNWTNCTTDMLAFALSKHEATLSVAAQIKEKSESSTPTTTPIDNAENENICDKECDYKEAYSNLVYGIAAMLINLDNDTLENIQECMHEISNEIDKHNAKDVDFSDDEINSMFK